MTTKFPSFLICGPEHSGTTLLSDIFRQTLKYNSGFECGIWLADSPVAFRQLEPFASIMKKSWMLNTGDFDYICSSKDIPQFYERLIDRSTVVSCDRFFDKTPRYLTVLPKIREQTDIPIYICYKDPRSIVASDFTRAQTENFENWFNGYCEKKKRYLTTLYDNFKIAKDGQINDCCLVRLEGICLDARKTLDQVFSFINEKFELSYLNMKGLRYKHTKEKYIATNIPFNYLNIFNREQILRIEREFSIFDDWFYE